MCDGDSTVARVRVWNEEWETWRKEEDEVED